MAFLDDVIAAYKREGNKDLYDCNGKTALQIVEDFKIHIIEDIKSYLNFSKFIFKDSINDELVNEIINIARNEIYILTYVNNNKIFIDLNSFI